MSSLGFKTLCMVISFLVLWSICLTSSLIYFKGDRSGVYLFHVIPAAELDFKKFSRSSEILFFYFLYFISICLIVSAPQVLVSFLFCKRSDSLFIYQFYSFHYLSFPTFDKKHFSMPILFLYPDCICFESFSKQLKLIALTAV